MDGVDVCRAIRAASDLPIIIVSRAARWTTASWACTPARTTTWSSRTTWVSWWPGWSGVPAAAGGRSTSITPELIEVDGCRWIWPGTRGGGRRVGHAVRKEFQVLALLATAGGACAPATGSWLRCGGAAGRGRTYLDVHVATLRTKLVAPSWSRRCAGGLPAGPVPRRRVGGGRAAPVAGHRDGAGGHGGRGLGVPLAVTAAGARCRPSSSTGWPTRCGSPRWPSARWWRPTRRHCGRRMQRYDEVYGIAGHWWPGTAPSWSPLARAVGGQRRPVRVALAGRRSEPYPLLLPWTPSRCCWPNRCWWTARCAARR